MGMVGALMIELGLKKWVGVHHEAVAAEAKALAELAQPMSVVCLEWL